MPTTPESEIISRTGVFYTGYVCSHGGLIFRETTSTDVGVDGQIELVDEAKHATGMLAGVQVKSGDSFVNLDTSTFTFRAKRKHFEYWNRYCLPVIGVVYSPSLRKAVWFDLTKHADRILKDNGPFEIKEILNSQNELEPKNVAFILSDLIKKFHGILVSEEDVERIAKIQQIEPTKADQYDKEIAWKRLVTVFFASDSDLDVIANVGYRLSYLFPKVTDSQSEFLINRISRATDQELIRIISSIHKNLENNRDDVASLMCDLVRYLPDRIERLKSLAKSGLVPFDFLEALFQVIEYFSEEFEQEFRSKIIDDYTS